MSLLVWCLFQNCLSIKYNLVSWGILLPIDNRCVGGCGLEEITTHLFLHCSHFGVIWSLIRQWIGVSLAHPFCLVAHFTQFGHLCDFSNNLRSYLYLIWFALVWVIWNEMNNRIFNNKVEPMQSLLDKIKLLSLVWLKEGNSTFALNHHNWWLYPFSCMGTTL